jgi:hypothetical protein
MVLSGPHPQVDQLADHVVFTRRRQPDGCRISVRLRVMLDVDRRVQTVEIERVKSSAFRPDQDEMCVADRIDNRTHTVAARLNPPGCIPHGVQRLSRSHVESYLQKCKRWSGAPA